MATKTKHRIVLAKLVDDTEVVDPGAADIGRRPTLKQIKRPVAVVWALNGSDKDLASAHKHAAAEGYTVFVYETAERKPLERAKADIAR